MKHVVNSHDISHLKCKIFFKNYNLENKLEVVDSIKQYEQQLIEYDKERREIIKDKEWISEEKI